MTYAILSDIQKPAHIADAEWALRVQLTEFYHLIDYMGWTEMIFNHISARLPGEDAHYLVNPFGLNYYEVTPENLLKVDHEGHLIDPSPYPGNPAGFALHARFMARGRMCIVSSIPIRLRFRQ